jgi:hypothetical protein
MKRHYYIGDTLADIEHAERQLLKAGIPEVQVHLLSNERDESDIQDLHPVADFMKTDVIRQGLWGLLLGTVGAIIVMLGATSFGGSDRIGLVPFAFLAVVVLGFCTWEGGFLGFQTQNRRFRRFQQDLRAGRHILFVDVDLFQEETMLGALMQCQGLSPAGTGKGMPTWLVTSQRLFQRFMHWAP